MVAAIQRDEAMKNYTEKELQAIVGGICMLVIISVLAMIIIQSCTIHYMGQ